MPCRPLTPRPLTRSTRPLGVPGATLTRTGVPSSVGTDDRRAEGRLGEGDRQLDGEVVAVAAEHRVLVDGDGEDQVALGRAGVALGTLAAQPDLLAVLDPGRDLGRDPAALGGLQGDRGALDGVAEAQRRAGLHVGTGPWAARRAEPGERVGAATRATGAAGAGGPPTEHLREQVVEVGLAGSRPACPPV